MNQQKQLDIEPYFLQILLILGLILMFFLYSPFLSIFVIAFVMTIIFRPIFMKILRWTRHSNVIAALLGTAAIIVIILIPLLIFADLVLRELSSALSSQSPLIHISNIHLPSYIQRFNFDFQAYVKNLTNSIIGNVGLLFSNITTFVIYTILTIITLVYLFKDGHIIRAELLKTLPFTADQKNKLTEDIASGVRAVIGGYMLTAIIQGIVSGVGFWIFGVPNPALWGFVALFAAFIPTVGTSIINLPMVVFLFLNHKVGASIGLLIWYLIAITIIDNYIGPRFISGRVKIHPLLILFSILGGLQLFGSFGFLIGPLALILFWSILQMVQEYESEP